MVRNKIIAVDFDGTLCGNKFPNIGAPNVDLIHYLKCRQASTKERVLLILWTCRVGEKLDAAVEFCSKFGLHFDYINENAAETIQEFGSDSRKIFAHEYIDDRAVNPRFFGLPYSV